MGAFHTVTHPEVFSSSKALVHVENSSHTSDLAMHGHEFAEVVIVRDGQAIHTTEAGSFDIRKGTVVTLGPNSWHAYQNESRLRLSVLYVSKSLLQRSAPVPPEGSTLGDVCASGEVTVRDLAADAQDSLARLADRFSAGVGKTVFAELALFYQVLDALSQVRPSARYKSNVPESAPFSEPVSGQSYSDLIAESIHQLRHGLDEDWNLDRLAAHVSISPGHLSRLFRQETGTSPMAFLNQLRAERMASILRSGTTAVASAGRAVGWPDPSYASRRFAAHWGTTPSAYRRRTAYRAA
ncbi:helix-turn-helix domain-containing protein [Paenarthrobacter sp. NCHU4564]|uniref:helix-turn-helix domain-containing protein n=1 Tax=Paenarthrobacter sp. NCHU4564 TaxID=3451353 RepID=UPI003F956446